MYPNQGPNSEIQTKFLTEFSSLLFIVTSTGLLEISISSKEKNLIENHTHFPMVKEIHTETSRLHHGQKNLNVVNVLHSWIIRLLVSDETRTWSVHGVHRNAEVQLFMFLFLRWFLDYEINYWVIWRKAPANGVRSMCCRNVCICYKNMKNIQKRVASSHQTFNYWVFKQFWYTCNDFYPVNNYFTLPLKNLCCCIRRNLK